MNEDKSWNLVDDIVVAELAACELVNRFDLDVEKVGVGFWPHMNGVVLSEEGAKEGECIFSNVIIDPVKMNDNIR